MNNDKLKIGVIGAGNMGKNHIRNLSEMNGKNVEFVGFYDKNEEEGRKVEKMYEIEYYRDLEKLLKKIKAVDIVAPSSLHLKLGLLASEHNLHAFIEKPLALNAEDAKILVNKFEQIDKKLMVGHIERFNPVVTELKKILENEKPISFEVRRCSPFDKRISDADVVQDLMIHDIDIIFNYLATSKIAKFDSFGASVFTEKVDYGQLITKLEDKTLISIIASRITENKIRTINIHCKNCYIEADLLSGEIKIFRCTDYKLNIGYDPSYKQQNNVEVIKTMLGENLRRELMHFVDCIQNDKEPLTNGKDAINSLNILKRVNKSYGGK